MKCFITYASDLKEPEENSKFIEINDLDELKSLPERFNKLKEWSFDLTEDGYDLVLEFNCLILNNAYKITGKCLRVIIYDYYLE